MMRLPPVVRASLEDALTLLLPVDCAGCDAPDTALCPDCRAALASRPAMRRLDDGTAVWSALRFEGVPARVVRALKEDGRTSLAAPLGLALRAAVLAAAGRDAGDPVPLAVVPLPTSRAAFVRRGYRVPELLARAAGCRVAPLLTPARRTADQRGLDRAARRDNVSGAFALRRRTDVTRVILVDDVITTGSTLAEAARALRAGGVDVAACATVAATPLLTRGGGGGQVMRDMRDPRG